MSPDVLSILNLVIGLGTILGGIFAYRYGFKKASEDMQKQAGEIQTRVISALKDELGILKEKIEAIEKENVRLKRIIDSVKKLLTLRGIHIIIDGDIVSIGDRMSTDTYIADGKENEKAVP